jgi:hypothetical protein
LNALATELRTQFRIEAGSAIFAYFDGAILVEGEAPFAFSKHPNDEHLKAIDYQDSAGTNYDYGLLRMECGVSTIPSNAGAGNNALAITFGTAFSKILSFVVSSDDGDYNKVITADLVSTSGATVRASKEGVGGTTITATDVHWIAIGVK